MRHAGSLWLAVLLCVVSCIDADFARPSRVQTDRVLAITADPPVAGTDASPELRAVVVRDNGEPLLHDPALGTTLVWTACLVPEGLGGGGGGASSQYDGEGMQQGCGGAAALPLVTGADGSTRLPAGLLTQLVSDETLMPVASLLNIPVSLLRDALQRTGVIVTVQLQVMQEGEPALLAVKRVVLIDRLQRDVIGSNPPPPRWSMRLLGEDVDDARWLTGRGRTDRFTCDWEAEPLRVQTGRTYVLDPVNLQDANNGSDDDPEADDDWRESYEVVDLSGAFTTLQEQAYYAWFSTEGRLDQEQTTPPADEELWTAPATPGRTPLWLVVRDGHAGVSACRVDIDVVAR